MTASKELFAGVFSRHAQAYRTRHEQIRRQGRSRGRARLLELLAVRRDERVLDLCCGPGNLGEELGSSRVVGIDLAPGMLELVPFPAVLGDAEALPFAEGSFAAVACGHGLQFVPNLPAVLSECRRVGSRLAASVPLGGRSRDRAQEILDRLLPPFPATPDRDATLAVVRSPDALVQAARAAGFGSARCEEVAAEVVWPNPRVMMEQSLGWWSCAARLEGLPPSEGSRILEEAVATFVAEAGDGPVRIPGSDLVLYASA